MPAVAEPNELTGNQFVATVVDFTGIAAAGAFICF